MLHHLHHLYSRNGARTRSLSGKPAAFRAFNPVRVDLLLQPLLLLLLLLGGRWRWFSSGSEMRCITVFS